MQTEVRHSPAFAVATLTLAPGEPVKAESGAMVAMASDTQIQTSTQGGFVKALKRSALGGESFFINTFTEGPAGGWIQVGAHLPGDVVVLELTGNTWFVQSGSFLASTYSIELDTQWGGAKTFFAGEGLALLRCSGTGPLILSSYGAIDRFTLQPGQPITIDTGHVVAFSDTVQWNVRRIGGMKATMLSGEVVDLMGPGEVLMQSRNVTALEGWIRSLMPPDRS